MQSYEFDATITAIDDMDAAYVKVPYNLPKVFGMGRMKVYAKFDDIAYEGSIVSSTIGGKKHYIIGITKAIRQELGKGPGDTVHVSFRQRQIEGSAWTYWQLFVKKLEAKGKSEADLKTVATWLLGYSEDELSEEVLQQPYMDWLEAAPAPNPLAKKISGKICGYTPAEIEDTSMRRMRQFDKLVDNVAKGKKKAFPTE